MRDEALALTVDSIGEPEEAAVRLSGLFDRHHGRLFRLARRLAGSHDDARDLVQETFLRVASCRRGLPEEVQSEEAWLVRVMINVARNEWRKRRGRQALEAVHLDETAPPSPGSPEAAAVARQAVWRALTQLPPRRRAMIVLYELEGIPVARIAELLGASAVTVRWNLAYGRRQLARLIEPGTRP